MRDRFPPRRAVLGPIAALSALGLLLGSCGGSGFQYVKDKEAGVVFKIPGAWRLFDEREVLDASLGDLSPQRAQVSASAQWITAFDADPDPSLGHVLDSNATHPAGLAQVRGLSQTEHDTFSLQSLRDAVFPIDDLQNDPTAQVEELVSEDVVLDGGFHGTHIVYNLKTEGSTRFLTFDQTALLDPATSRLYLFIVGCEANCYVDNEDTIRTIVASWTLKG